MQRVQEIQTSYDDLNREVERLRMDHNSLVGEVEELRDENAGLRDAVASMEDLIGTMFGHDDGPAMSPSPSPPPIDVLEPPQFQPQSDKFYVVRKGRCPGIYSDLYVLIVIIRFIDITHHPSQYVGRTHGQ